MKMQSDRDLLALMHDTYLDWEYEFHGLCYHVTIMNVHCHINSLEKTRLDELITKERVKRNKHQLEYWWDEDDREARLEWLKQKIEEYDNEL